jgi:hypothetical protein
MHLVHPNCSELLPPYSAKFLADGKPASSA